MCPSNRPKPLEDKEIYPLEVGPNLFSENWNWCSAPFLGKAHVSGKHLTASVFGSKNNFGRLGRVIFAKAIAKLYSSWNQRQQHCESRL